LPLVNSFFEARTRGEFSFHNLSLSLANTPKPIDWEALRAQADDERMDVWLDHSAHIHELRHYHDLIGSVSGFHLFLEVTELVDKFFWILHQSGPEISIPISSTGPCANALELYNGYRKFFSAVFGDDPLEIAPAEEPIDIASGERRYLSTKRFISARPKVDTVYPLVEYPRLNPHTGISE
jgi:hypothetical protein